MTVRVLRELFYEPDVQAVRAVYSAIAADDLKDGPPVWPMTVAPPGSAKTTILQPLEQLDHVYPIDKLTPNTFLSGQISTKRTRRRPSLLHRIGSRGIVIFPDFSTVLAMKPDDKNAVLADLRRIFDGHLRKEVGTSEEAIEWSGRITCAVAVTPDIDKHYSVFQSLGERFVMIRWHRPGGEDDAEEAALHAMNQDPEIVRASLATAVGALFDGWLPTRVLVPRDLQQQIAALAEFVVRARTHVARDYHKTLIYAPEAEASTRLSQQLRQLARGSARLSRRRIVNEHDLALVRRVGFDCIPSLRCRLLWSFIRGERENIPKATLSYLREDLEHVSLLAKQSESKTYSLSRLARGLLQRAGVGSPEIPSERVTEKRTRTGRGGGEID